MNQFNKLLACLENGKRIIIQTHDFPDHDAVASGFALCRLLESYGHSTLLCYTGRLESKSLSTAVESLQIPLLHSTHSEVQPNDQLIIVDGFVGNRNVTNISGQLIGLIDHHSPPGKSNAQFHDIREHIGACATIIYSYYREAGIEPEKNVSTALLMGLLMDTAFMTRGVSREDMTAFSELFFMGDWHSGIRLLKNSLSLHDLQIFSEAINSCEVVEYFAFIPVQKKCSLDVMAITADFFLDILEITFVVVLVPAGDDYRISVRSEDLSHPADSIIRKALKGIGHGGGHFHMAAGSIGKDLFPGQEALRNRFLDAMDS